MLSDFPGSPHTLKGALVVFETRAPIPTNLIVFQYNPETMSRSFSQQSSDGDPRQQSGRSVNLLPPTESFSVTVELDAADQLEAANPLVLATGLHPTLAALELLLYPPSTALILNKVLALAGSALISPAQSPMVLFVWGPARVLPVRVSSVSFTEEAFDQLLNPIRAKVQLSLRTLTGAELRDAGPPFDTLALVQQIAKEVLARANIFVAVDRIGASLSF